jgi:hypothetical protein
MSTPSCDYVDLSTEDDESVPESVPESPQLTTVHVDLPIIHTPRVRRGPKKAPSAPKKPAATFMLQPQKSEAPPPPPPSPEVPILSKPPVLERKNAMFIPLSFQKNAENYNNKLDDICARALDGKPKKLAKVTKDALKGKLNVPTPDRVELPPFDFDSPPHSKRKSEKKPPANQEKKKKVKFVEDEKVARQAPVVVSALPVVPAPSAPQSAPQEVIMVDISTKELFAKISQIAALQARLAIDDETTQISLEELLHYNKKIAELEYECFVSKK